MPTIRDSEQQLADDIRRAASATAGAIERDAVLTAEEAAAQRKVWREHYAAAWDGDR